jgi:hypothetical protein
MASQNSADAPVAADPVTLPDRSQNPAETDKAAPQGETSKNAAKKAAKLAKQAAEKAEKAANKGIGKSEAKKATLKAPKKKIEGAALIGIDVSKEEDFPGWYQQVLTKGDMLDYYDVSGCFILKVRLLSGTGILPSTIIVPLLMSHSLLLTLSGRRFRTGSMQRSRRLASRTARSLYSSPRMCCRERRITSKVSLLKLLG